MALPARPVILVEDDPFPWLFAETELRGANHGFVTTSDGIGTFLDSESPSIQE